MAWWTSRVGGPACLWGCKDRVETFVEVEGRIEKPLLRLKFRVEIPVPGGGQAGAALSAATQTQMLQMGRTAQELLRHFWVRATIHCTVLNKLARARTRNCTVLDKLARARTSRGASRHTADTAVGRSEAPPRLRPAA